jgi:type III pantothenate kinase
VCGTATTIDFISAEGLFKGGMIMPGVGLMLRSLHEGTAALPDQDGDFSMYPTQTVDAIASGCQHAQAGAIERLFAMESRNTPGVVCVLSGGAAGAVAPRLGIPFEPHDNLVLEGLYRISQDV